MKQFLALFALMLLVIAPLCAECQWEGDGANYRLKFTVKLDDAKNPLPNYGIGFLQVADGKIKDLNITFFFVKSDSVWVYEYPAIISDIKKADIADKGIELMIFSEKDPTKSTITFTAKRPVAKGDCDVELLMQMPSFGPAQPEVKMVFKTVKEIILPQLPLKQL